MALPMEPETAPMFDQEAIPPFVDAPEVEELAERLLAKHPELEPLAAEIHDDVATVRVAYVFDTAAFDPAKDEVTHATLGKAMKAPPVWRHLAGVEAVIVIRRWFWERFDERQRGAVLMHELLHLDPIAPGKLRVKEHSIEEFAAVMRRYGAYLPDRAAFINEWAKWESEEGGKPASLDAKRSTKIGIMVGDRHVETDMEGLERASRDAQRGKPKAEA